MGVYDANGNELFAVYGADGNELDYAYDANGNEIYRRSTERRIIFEDDFDTFDDSMWTKEIGLVRNQESEFQCYRAENVTVQDSCLVLTAKKESYGDRQWTSGSISGQTKQEFYKGRFEARIKFVNKSGAWAGFWMLGSNFWKTYVDGGVPTNHGVIWPRCGEIDIMEQLGGMQSVVWDRFSGAHKDEYRESLNIEEWHVYAFEWTDEYMEFSVDDVVFFHFTEFATAERGFEAYKLPFYMILNYAIRSGATDALDGTAVYVDWVRVYEPLRV